MRAILTLCTDTKCPSKPHCRRYAPNYAKALNTHFNGYADFLRPETDSTCRGGYIRDPERWAKHHRKESLG